MATSPFLWGDGGSMLTPDELKERRKITQALLLKRVGDYSPIQHPMQGVARVADALLAGLEYRGDKAESDKLRAYGDAARRRMAGELDPEVAGGTSGGTSAPPVKRFPTSIGNVPDPEGTTGDSIRSRNAAGNGTPLSGDREEVRQYVRQAALARGIDPDVAERGIKQESGFNPYARNRTDKEDSHGVMQLNTMGGLGAEAQKQGISLDPKNWKQHVDFGLDVAAKDGWRQWYGFRDVGIGRWDGIGKTRTAGAGPMPAAPDPAVNPVSIPGQVASSDGYVPGAGQVAGPGAPSTAPAAAPAAAPTAAPAAAPASTNRRRAAQALLDATDPRLDNDTQGMAKLIYAKREAEAAEERARTAEQQKYVRTRTDTRADVEDERRNQRQVWETQKLPFEAASSSQGQGNLDVSRQRLNLDQDKWQVEQVPSELRRGRAFADPANADALAAEIKLRHASRDENKTIINNAANPFVKGPGDRFNEAMDKANASRQQIPAIHEARKALDEGAITGAGADLKLGVAKVFGLAPDAAVNTETLRSALGTQILENAKKLGANPSNADNVIIREVTGAKSDLQEGTIRRVIDMQERWARQSIRYANEQGEKAIKALPEELKHIAPMLTVDEPPTYEDFVKENPIKKRGAAPERPTPATSKDGPAAPANVDPKLWQHMTPEERALWK